MCIRDRASPAQFTVADFNRMGSQSGFRYRLPQLTGALRADPETLCIAEGRVDTYAIRPGLDVYKRQQQRGGARRVERAQCQSAAFVVVAARVAVDLAQEGGGHGDHGGLLVRSRVRPLSLIHI